MGSASSATKKGRKSRAKVRRRPVKAASVLRWVRAARRRGLTGPQLVYELHVRRGFALPKVARVLRAGLEVVRRHWRKHCAERARTARPPTPPRILPPLSPQSEGDVAALREHVSVMLWETVVATFPEVTAAGEKKGADEPGPPTAKPPLLAVRVRALKQMGRLYGVGGKKQRSAKRDAVPVRCATPEEIAESVRERMRGREGPAPGGTESSISQPGMRCEAIA